MQSWIAVSHLDKTVCEEIADEAVQVSPTHLGIDIERLGHRTAQTAERDWRLKHLPDLAADFLDAVVGAVLEVEEDVFGAKFVREHIACDDDDCRVGERSRSHWATEYTARR